jgi:hypothetical protein
MKYINYLAIGALLGSVSASTLSVQSGHKHKHHKKNADDKTAEAAQVASPVQSTASAVQTPATPVQAPATPAQAPATPVQAPATPV